MFISIVTPAYAKVSDIHGHWAQQQIQEWNSKGFVAGYSDGTFMPDKIITRAEFFTLVNRLLKFEGTAVNEFTDVSPNDWFAQEINKAKAAGYISGYQDGTIKANEPISRQEIAVIMARLLKLDVTEKDGKIDVFKDNKDMPIWARGAINAVVSKSFIGGYPDETFKPGKPATRAEAIVILGRIAKNKIVISEPGVYGLGNIYGQVVIDAENITLKDTVINGDLLIAESVGEGEVYLDNVTVKGNTYIYGGGQNSIRFKDCILLYVIVDKANGEIRLVASGTTEIDTVVLQSGAVLVEENLTKSGFKDILVDELMPKNDEVNLSGNFLSVRLNAEKVKMLLTKGLIDKLEATSRATNSSVVLSSGAKVVLLIVNAKMQVTGNGSIYKAVINAEGVRIERKPVEIVLNDGIKVTIGYGTEQSNSSSDNNDDNDDNDDDNDDNDDDNDDNDDDNDDNDGDDDNKDNDDEKEIVQEVADNLQLTIINARGKSKPPSIDLPASDSLDYDTQIMWTSHDENYIEVKENKALIYRRGKAYASGGEHDEDDGCGEDGDRGSEKESGCGESDSGCSSNLIQSIASDDLQIVILGCSDSGSDHEDSCSGGGGKKTIVDLTATISKGSISNTKTFKINIYWGWGKDITIGNEEGHDESGVIELPEANDIELIELREGQYPIFLTAQQLATYGQKVTDAATVSESVYSSVYGAADNSVIELKVLTDGRLKINPKHSGEAQVVATVGNALGDTDVGFSVNVKKPEVADDKDAVSEASRNLNLSLYSTGHGPEQINKVNLPYTDMFGYSTEITWKSSNSEFVKIDKDKAMIYRRGNSTYESSEKEEDGECDSEHSIAALSLAGSEDLSISCSDDSEHDDGGCGEDSADNQSGKGTKVYLTATIRKGDISSEKTFEFFIPWGWGREIVIKEN
ncbi:MAG: S-layer homology domain-containing protein [Clostridia bacterium]